MAATMGLLEVVLETDATLVKMALDGDDYRLLALADCCFCRSFLLIALVCVLET